MKKNEHCCRKTSFRAFATSVDPYQPADMHNFNWICTYGFTVTEPIKKLLVKQGAQTAFIYVCEKTVMLKVAESQLTKNNAVFITLVDC